MNLEVSIAYKDNNVSMDATLFCRLRETSKRVLEICNEMLGVQTLVNASAGPQLLTKDNRFTIGVVEINDKGTKGVD